MTVPASSLLAVLPGASASPTGTGAATGDVGGGAFDGLLASLMTGPGEGGVSMPGTKAAARPGRPDSDRASTEDLALDAAAAQMLLAPPGATPIIYAPTAPLSAAGMPTEGSPASAPVAAALAPTPPVVAAPAGPSAGPAGEPTPATAAFTAPVAAAGVTDKAIIVPPALTVGTPATASTPGHATADAYAVPAAPRDGQAANPDRPLTPVARDVEAPLPAAPAPQAAAAPGPAGQAARTVRPDASPRPAAELAASAPTPAPVATAAEAPAIRAPAPAPAPAPTVPIAAPPPVGSSTAAAAAVSVVAAVAEPAVAAATVPAAVAPVRDPATPAAAARRDNARQHAGAERGVRTSDGALTAVRSAGPAFVAPSDGPLAGLDANSASPLPAADPLTADVVDAGDDRAPVLPADLRAAAGLPTPPDATPTARGAPETVARLAADIVRKLEGQSTRFDLQLDPHGLGKVDVAIEIDRKGKLTAALSFDSPQTAADLRGRAGELRLALEQAGFDVSESSLTFNAAGQGAGPGGREAGQQQDRAWNGRAFQRVQSGLDEADLTLAATPINPARRTRSGVDIRI